MLVKLTEHFRFLWSLTFILTDVQFMQTPNDWKILNFGFIGLIGLCSFNRDTGLSQTLLTFVFFSGRRVNFFQLGASRGS